MARTQSSQFQRVKVSERPSWKKDKLVSVMKLMMMRKKKMMKTEKSDHMYLSEIIHQITFSL
jgi:hypothetical protein